MSCDVGKAPLILQASLCFTCVTAHSATLPLLYLRHSSFSNPSVALPTSTAHSPTLLSLLLRQRFSLTSSGEPPMHRVTRFRKLPGSNPGAKQSIIFSGSPTVTQANAGMKLHELF